MAVHETKKTSISEKDHVEVSSVTSRNDRDVGIESVEPKGDYSGAAKKTDPVEIKLVRKLDIRIMVIVLSLNYYCV